MPQEKRPLKQLQSGEEVTDFFVIRKLEVRTKRADGAPYLALELGNANGRIPATIWEEVPEKAALYRVGDTVKVLGKVVDYKGGHTLSISKIRKAREGEIAVSDLLPGPRKDPKELRAQFEALLDSVQDLFLRELLSGIFSGETLKRFYESPAGKLWHHNRVGGLLEHTLGVAEICDFAASRHLEVQRDLLITGALLHDLGKTASYRTDQGFIDYTDEGRLIGHLAIGAALAQEGMATVRDFPQEYANQILHMILSHHGELAHGSPVVPMTLEALILYQADELDSKIDAYLRIAGEQNSDERRWSSYVRLMDRFFYFPRGSIQTDEPET